MRRFILAICFVLSLITIGMSTHTVSAASTVLMCWGHGYATLTTSTGTEPFASLRACILYGAQGGTPRPVGLIVMKDVTLASSHIYPAATGTMTLNGAIQFAMVVPYPYRSPATVPAVGSGTYTTTGNSSVFGPRGTFTVTGLRQAVFLKDKSVVALNCQSASVRGLTLDAQFRSSTGGNIVKTQLQVETAGTSGGGNGQLYYAAVRADGRYPYYWLLPGVTTPPASDMALTFAC